MSDYEAFFPLASDKFKDLTSNFEMSVIGAPLQDSSIDFGRISKATRFDSSFYLKSKPSEFISTYGNSLTLSAWIKKDCNVKQSGIIELSTGKVNSKALLFLEENKWKFRIIEPSGKMKTISAVQDSLPEWTYVAGCYDDTTKIIFLYVNGILVDSIQTEGLLVYLPQQSFLTIGSLTNGVYPFKGLLNNVSWRKDAVSLEQIQNIYWNTKT